MTTGCDIFTRTFLSCVTVSLLPVRYTSAGPLSLKQNGVLTLVITSGLTDCTVRTQHTLVAEQVTVHFVDPRVAACTHCTAEERVCLFQAVTGGFNIFLA